jgi:hypothetical protein
MYSCSGGAASQWRSALVLRNGRWPGLVNWRPRPGEASGGRPAESRCMMLAIALRRVLVGVTGRPVVQRRRTQNRMEGPLWRWLRGLGSSPQRGPRARCRGRLAGGHAHPRVGPTTSEAMNSRPLLHLLVLSQAQAPPLDPSKHVVRGSSSRDRQSGRGLPLEPGT